MRVAVLLEHRFDRTPDGRVWTQTMFPHSFWNRYLAVFDRVRIVARTRCVEQVPSEYLRVDGDGVELYEVPHYLGSAEFFKRFRRIRSAVLKAFEPTDAVILRVSSQLAACADRMLIGRRQPFGLEVVCDPWEAFAPRALRHPLRPWLRRYFTARLHHQCRHAAAVAYVTEQALQARYPARSGAFTTSYSSVELPPSAFADDMPRRFSWQTPLRIVSVGSLAHHHKGMDVLIDAMHLIASSHASIQLTIVGDGLHRAELEARAAAGAAAKQICFAGQLSAGAAVRTILDQSHLCVMASRLEGLPRAMIEAMARGLPCIGTRVGGIPELLGDEELVDAEDPGQLAKSMLALLGDPDRAQRLSARNFEKARNYSDEKLQPRRVEFYQALAEATRRGSRAAAADHATPLAVARQS